MSLLKKIFIVLLIIFFAIQFIQPARNTNGHSLPTDISKVVSVPENVQSLLKVACYDCHSNHTNYPWYTYLQPVGWILHNHIVNGKEELNFNAFGSYSKRRQQSKLKDIADQVRDDEMPLSSYRLMHKQAMLNKDEKASIIDWAQNAKDSLSKINP